MSLQSKPDVLSTLQEYLFANPGSSVEQIRAALKDKFPAVHFDTLLEVHSSKGEFCRVNFLVPKTENQSQRLVTLYFPRGTLLGL